MSKKAKILSLLAVATLGYSSVVMADSMGAQVFYRYGWNMLKTNRGGELFTDVAGRNGTLNDGKSGWNIGAGLDLPMFKAFGPGDLLGEVALNYAHFSKKNVSQTAAVLAGITAAQSEVTVSELQVLVAPKYRLSYMEGFLRPWIIPAGLAFLVNSPPSNDSTYLDVGYQAGLGLEAVLMPQVSLGVDYRYTIAFKEPKVDASGGQVDFYLGLNF